jgi:hypothetical protein
MFLVKVFTEGKKVVGKAFLSKKRFFVGIFFTLQTYAFFQWKEHRKAFMPVKSIVILYLFTVAPSENIGSPGNHLPHLNALRSLDGKKGTVVRDKKFRR